jgi:hypothetical protein
MVFRYLLQALPFRYRAFHLIAPPYYPENVVAPSVDQKFSLESV